MGWDKICVPMENGGLGIKKLTKLIEHYGENDCAGLGLRRQGFGGG